jgi:uncharacterized protein
MLDINLARSWYPENDAVHGFDHVLRVYAMAEKIAAAEGADLEIVGAAALLHDATPPEDAGLELSEARAAHQHISAAFAGQILTAQGWAPERIAAVQHCIRAHRFRDRNEPPNTLEARVLFDADKLDAIGTIGAARAVAYAAQAGQPAYAPISSEFLEYGLRQPGEAHSAYHEFLFKLRKIQERLYTPSAQHIAESRCLAMAEFFVRLEQENLGLA